MAQMVLTTAALWHISRNEFMNAENQLDGGDPNPNLGIAQVAIGLARLNEALLATLTHMSQDIAALKAEVDALKKPTPNFQGLQAGSHHLRK
jgi:hypothetical protein